MAKRRRKQDQPEIVRRDGGLGAYFVNTGSTKRKGVATYAELVAWGTRAGVLTAGAAEHLGRAAAERPGDAAAVTARALELRACLRRILLALATGGAPAAADLAALNAELFRASSARRLVASGRGARWSLGDPDGDNLDRMLWPVASSAGDLLSTKHHRNVRQCAGEGCDLLFVDRSGGSPRKWCSMRACGNKVKSLRHYHRSIKPGKERREERFREKGWAAFGPPRGRGS